MEHCFAAAAARPLPLRNVEIRDHFWDRYTGLVTREIIPYQYQVLNDLLPDVPESHCIKNFRIAAGLEEGEFRGWVFQDSDLAKFLEAVAFSLNYKSDGALERTADELIRLVGMAQEENGYLNTHFSIRYPGRQYCNLKEGHELYTAGHFIEAAVAYYHATGKDEFLNIMRRCADHIIEVFHREDYIDAVPGHEEIELALVKLADVTGEEKYARMAQEFVDRRGCSDYLTREHTLERYINVWRDPNAYKPCYGQAHAPVREQTTAEGHAVRALYLYTAMADLAGRYRDESLLRACETLYENITEKRMYITGGIGSSDRMERFTTDYDLPNDTAYAESCASIALAMFCRRMAAITGEAKYMDTAERALMNTVLAGVGLDGKGFFYVNPLEVIPAHCLSDTDKQHVQPRRQGWFGCACCPPNIARTLASLGDYAYSCDGEKLFVNLFVGGGAKAVVKGREVALEVRTEMPYRGETTLRLTAAEDMDGTLCLRIPEYAEKPEILAGGETLRVKIVRGYGEIPLSGREMEISFRFGMPPRLICGNPRLAAAAGKCAVQKGPLVYCMEEADNGSDLAALLLDPNEPLREEFDSELLGGTTVITAQGLRPAAEEFDKPLYRAGQPKLVPAHLRFVPYCFWCNREIGEMRVWIRYLQK